MFDRIYALLVFPWIIISCSVGWVISCLRHGREFNRELDCIETWKRYVREGDGQHAESKE